MRVPGLTPSTQFRNKLQLKKRVARAAISFIVACLMSIVVIVLFASGIMTGDQPVGPEYAVAKLITPTSTGSAFRVSESKFMTARHVIDELKTGDKVILSMDKFSPPIEVEAEIVYMPADPSTEYASAYNDFAILEARETELLQGVPILFLGISADVQVRDEVYAIGYPEGNSENRTTTGIVSATTFNDGKSEYDYLFDVDADVDHGNSGGPLVLQSTGEVIGVIIMVQATSLTNYNIALTIDRIREELAKGAPELNLEE